VGLVLCVVWGLQPAQALLLAASLDGGDTFSTLVLGPPSQLTATGQPAGAVALDWTPPAAASLRTVAYSVQRSPHGQGSWTTVTSAGNPSYQDLPATDGQYDYRVISTASSFTSVPSATATGVSDRVAPTVTLTCNTASCLSTWYTSAPVTVALAAADGGSGVASITHTLDGTMSTTSGASWSTSLSDGTHSLTYHATDQVGNTSPTGSQTIRVDSTPPVISSWAVCGSDGVVLPALPNWMRSKGTFQVFANVSDATSGVATVTADVGGTASSSLPGSFATATLAAGSASCAGTTYNFVSSPLTSPSLSTAPESVYVDLVATDLAGNSVESNADQAGTVGVDKTTPSKAKPSVTPGAAGSGNVTVTWNSSSVGVSGLAGYQLKVCLAGTSCTAPAQYPNPLVVTGLSYVLTLTPGVSYDIYVTASDNAGNNSPTQSQTGVTAP
jgi:hypothetical protein